MATRPITIGGYFNLPPFTTTINLTEEEIQELDSLSSPWQAAKILAFLKSKGLTMDLSTLSQRLELDITSWDDPEAPEEE